MNTGSAIIISAIMVGVIYAWRWFTGGETPAAAPSAKSVTGVGPLVSPEGFLVAWGTIYLILSILAAFSEPLASSMAISILLGDILTNGVGISKSTTELREAKTTQQSSKRKVGT